MVARCISTNFRQNSSWALQVTAVTADHEVLSPGVEASPCGMSAVGDSGDSNFQKKWNSSSHTADRERDRDHGYNMGNFGGVLSPAANKLDCNAITPGDSTNRAERVLSPAADDWHPVITTHVTTHVRQYNYVK